MIKSEPVVVQRIPSPLRGPLPFRQGALFSTKLRLVPLPHPLRHGDAVPPRPMGEARGGSSALAIAYLLYRKTRFTNLPKQPP